MRYLIAFLMMIMPFTFSHSREKGRLVNDTINQQEAVKLNELATICGLNYDFTRKKVAFYTGSGGVARTDKSRYFSACGEIKVDYDTITPLAKIYILDKDEKVRANGYDAEKVRANGYDAVIVYGSVKQFRSKKAYIRRLHRSKPLVKSGK